MHTIDSFIMTRTRLNDCGDKKGQCNSNLKRSFVDSVRTTFLSQTKTDILFKILCSIILLLNII